MTMRFELLGPLQVCGEGGVVTIKGARQRTLLAQLVLAAGHVVSVESLSEAVWGYSPPSTYRTQVAICVAGLRKMFREMGHEEVILTAHPGYRLAVRDHCVDVEIFEDRVRWASEAQAQRRLDDAAQLLSEALALWRGSSLAGITGSAIEAEAARLDEQRLLAMEQLAVVRLEQGECAAVIRQLAAMVHENPQREQARASLMLAQYRSGQRALALTTFRQGRTWSTEELGLEPGPQLRQLHEAILKGDVLAADPKPVSRLALIPRQLPSKTLNLVGRDWELDELRCLIPFTAERQATIGTVSGPAGMGKTALALHWARAVADAFPDGQLYADLKGYSHNGPPLTSDVTLERFLRALGVLPHLVPAEAGERQGLYNTLLSGRRLLIILDNVHSFSQIESLLPGSGTCRVLVTGRRHLSELNGEAGIRLRLAPLGAGSSVELLARVVGDGRVHGDPASALEVGDLCGHLPLALEAAGARLATRPHWTVRDLRCRLADPRLRLDELSFNEKGVRTSLNLSYQKLAPQCRRILRRLALLRVQPFCARTAAALLDTTVDDMENQLEILCDEQLVTALSRNPDGSTQYGLAGLARLFASELARAEEGRDQHLAARERAPAVEPDAPVGRG